MQVSCGTTTHYLLICALVEKLVVQWLAEAFALALAYPGLSFAFAFVYAPKQVEEPSKIVENLHKLQGFHLLKRIILIAFHATYCHWKTLLISILKPKFPFQTCIEDIHPSRPWPQAWSPVISASFWIYGQPWDQHATLSGLSVSHQRSLLMRRTRELTWSGRTVRGSIRSNLISCGVCVYMYKH